MRQASKFFLLLLLMAALMAFSMLKLKRWLDIDACLDSGGRWNYEENRCEYVTNTVNKVNPRAIGGKEDAKKLNPRSNNSNDTPTY